jgi:hypothetical protein
VRREGIGMDINKIKGQPGMVNINAKVQIIEANHDIKNSLRIN